MEQYHHGLCVYVYTLSNDHECAKDIVQNVFIRLWEQRQKVETIKSLRGYLYKSAYNCFIDYFRRERRTTYLEKKQLDIADVMITDENQALLQKRISLIRREIDKLPPKCKRTFLLSKDEGLTNLEISEYLNVSVRTVETQISKAFRILRKSLKEEFRSLTLLLMFGPLYGIRLSENTNPSTPPPFER